MHHSSRARGRGALLLALLIAVAGRGAAAQGAGAPPAPALDRTLPPTVPSAKPLVFPAPQQRSLANGIPVAIMEDHSRPVVMVSAVIRVSPLVEPTAKVGLGRVVAALMGEGTTRHTADQLTEAFGALGNTVSPTGFYTITANVDRSLDLMAEQFLHPAFPQAALDRIRTRMVADLARARERPDYIAQRVMMQHLYGADDPRARAATAATLQAITREDVVRFYETYYRPPNVKLVIAGDITPREAVAKLDRAFGHLARGTAGTVAPPPVRPIDSTVVYLYDRPGSAQSAIVVAQRLPPRDSPDRTALELLNTVLGGAFNSRLNLDLREQHHYAYFAQSSVDFPPLGAPGTLVAQTEVETDKTDSALAAMVRDVRDIRDATPVTADELAFARAAMTRDLPLRLETVAARAMALADLVERDEPLDYYRRIGDDYRRVSLDRVRRVAAHYISPQRMVLVVVGDRHAIEPALRASSVAPLVIVPPLSAE
ncbi:MAG: insulinase family protein [Gemmatimonadaceae bacterium]|nr:insulinase family protein [Gemmatimonadaceae bacterium]